MTTEPCDLPERVGLALGDFLTGRAAGLAAIDPELEPVSTAIGDFVLDGGKRLRPTFGYWGWRGAGGRASEDDVVVRALAALELVHACALMHDDVMDGSATRRGAPSVHERFAATHRANGWDGPPVDFGRAAAILLGDLALVWADEMLAWAGLPQDALVRARPAYDDMRTEVMAGQYLDVLAQAQTTVSIGAALAVARYKSAKYTVERPLHIGGLLHGCDGALLDTYSAYGLPLGEAFQLRDDVLGVFGDPELTGKPAGDDLREGKRTALVAVTLERGSPAAVHTVSRLLGDHGLDDEGVNRLRAIIEDTGARAAVEALITQRTEQALDALAAGPVEPEARRVLAQLAEAVTSRRR
ncbi:polyprenyl synthetase family protein [soil metagenome]